VLTWQESTATEPIMRRSPRLGIRPILLATLLAGCARNSPPLPMAGGIESYRVPWPDAFPSDVVVDGRGRVWFTDRLTHALGVFDPSSEAFRRIDTPTEHSAPYGVLRAPDGTIWFGESNGRRLGRLDPATGEIAEIPIDGLEHGPRLVAWYGGEIWFTSLEDDAFGRYDPATGRQEVWKGRIEEPYGIAAAAGAVWVMAQGGSRLYRVEGATTGDTLPWLDLSEPVLNQLPEPVRRQLSPEVLARLRSRRRGAGARRLSSDETGRVWVAEWGRGRVTGVDPRTDERIHVETLDQPSRPYGIATDARGRVWYSEQGNGTVVVYEPVAGERVVLDLPVAGGTVRHLAVDTERGRAWLPLSDVGMIAAVVF
jgi:virginiamycin B lyase